MTCDQCEKDISIWKLFWNGRIKHFDTLFKIRTRKMYVCEPCLLKYGFRLNLEG